MKKKLRPNRPIETANNALRVFRELSMQRSSWPCVPWEVVWGTDGFVYIKSVDTQESVCRVVVPGDTLASRETMARWGDRIVKCVNACEGVTDAQLVHGGVGFVERIIKAGLEMARHILDNRPERTDGS